MERPLRVIGMTTRCLSGGGLVVSYEAVVALGDIPVDTDHHGLPHHALHPAQPGDLGADCQAGAAGGQHLLHRFPPHGAALQAPGQLAADDDVETVEEHLSHFLQEASDGNPVR